MKLAGFAVAAALSISGIAGAATYRIDSAHSGASFKVRHLMISNVRGEFAKVTGTVDFDPTNLEESRIDATIDATTINTREAKRDAHLKSPDFFDTAKYPAITFVSKKITKAADNQYKAVGDLTMHGVTREVTLDVEATPEIKDPRGGARLGAAATTKINRKDFGLNWNRGLETGGVVVGDEVEIVIDVELIKTTKATD